MSTQEDIEAIRRLFADYCFYADARETERWRALFTEDCLFSSPYGDYRGHDGLREWHAKSEHAPNSLRHLTANSVIDVDGETATACSYVIVVDTLNNNKTSFAGVYKDQLEKIDGRWLFKTRTILLNPSETLD